MGEKRIRGEVEQDFLTTGTIAKKMDKSTETIRREIYAGRLKASTFNGDFLIKRKDFEEWVAKRVKPVEAK